MRSRGKGKRSRPGKQLTQRPWGADKFGVFREQKGATVAGCLVGKGNVASERERQGLGLQGPEATTRGWVCFHYCQKLLSHRVPQADPSKCVSWGGGQGAGEEGAVMGQSCRGAWPRAFTVGRRMAGFRGDISEKSPHKTCWRMGCGG